MNDVPDYFENLRRIRDETRASLIRPEEWSADIRAKFRVDEKTGFIVRRDSAEAASAEMTGLSPAPAP